MHDFSETTKTVHRLKQEIDTLKEKQSEALKQAIYTGMTTDEMKEYDQRRTHLTKLVQQLGMLEKAQ